MQTLRATAKIATMKRYLWLAFLVLLPVLAQADNFTVSCQPPAAFTDNTPIPAGTVITLKLYKSANPASPNPATDTLLATQTTCSFGRTNVGAGTYSHYITASVAGVESDPSAVVTTVVGAAPAPKPNPPGIPVVTFTPLAATAYSVIKSQGATPGEAGQLIMLPVGRTSATSCDQTQAVQLGGQTYRPVPTASVTFTGTARPVVAFAICS